MKPPLIEYIRENSSPLSPIPISNGPKDDLPKLDGIRGVVFDIYGTIMISAAGDISLADSETAPIGAMTKALQLSGVKAPQQAEQALLRYTELIKSQQQHVSQINAVQFPEIEIRDVWRELTGCTIPAKVELASVAYECTANPIWPMLGLEACLSQLNQNNLVLGIVSNAQFYTPLMFPAFFNNQTLEELGFSQHAMIFSYQMLEAKPSRQLFRKLADQLSNHHDLTPQEVLYIGNDRLKDIWPAQLEGFRTALFAGDERSLRWRSEDARLDDITPDATISSLSQISQIIALTGTGSANSSL